MVKYIVGFVISYLLFYLMFSFYETNFNINGWSSGSRGFCMIFGFAGFIITTVNLYDEKNNK
jgi:hypothetical protein